MILCDRGFIEWHCSTYTPLTLYCQGFSGLQSHRAGATTLFPYTLHAFLKCLVTQLFDVLSLEQKQLVTR